MKDFPHWSLQFTNLSIFFCFLFNEELSHLNVNSIAGRLSSLWVCLQFLRGSSVIEGVHIMVPTLKYGKKDLGRGPHIAIFKLKH